MEIYEHFETLGFHKSEVVVYINLVELGKANASSIAKKANLPRSTVYSVLDGLIKKGVVSFEQSKKTTWFLANNPKALIRMVENERKEQEELLHSKTIIAKELSSLIEPHFQKTTYSVPKLQFFEGKANVNNMLYDHSKIWQKSIANVDYTWWGYQDHTLVEHYKDWLDYHWSIMLEKERVQLFSNHSKIEKKLKGKIPRREIKLVPKNYNFTSTIWILGEYVVTFNTAKEPHYAFQLKDAVYARNQRQMFELLWESR